MVTITPFQDRVDITKEGETRRIQQAAETPFGNLPYFVHEQPVSPDIVVDEIKQKASWTIQRAYEPQFQVVPMDDLSTIAQATPPYATVQKTTPYIVGQTESGQDIIKDFTYVPTPGTPQWSFEDNKTLYVAPDFMSGAKPVKQLPKHKTGGTPTYTFTDEDITRISPDFMEGVYTDRPTSWERKAPDFMEGIYPSKLGDPPHGPPHLFEGFLIYPGQDKDVIVEKARGVSEEEWTGLSDEEKRIIETGITAGYLGDDLEKWREKTPQERGVELLQIEGTITAKTLITEGEMLEKYPFILPTYDKGEAGGFVGAHESLIGFGQMVPPLIDKYVFGDILGLDITYPEPVKKSAETLGIGGEDAMARLHVPDIYEIAFGKAAEKTGIEERKSDLDIKLPQLGREGLVVEGERLLWKDIAEQERKTFAQTAVGKEPLWKWEDVGGHSAERVRIAEEHFGPGYWKGSAAGEAVQLWTFGYVYAGLKGIRIGKSLVSAFKRVKPITTSLFKSTPKPTKVAVRFDDSITLGKTNGSKSTFQKYDPTSVDYSRVKSVTSERAVINMIPDPMTLKFDVGRGGKVTVDDFTLEGMSRQVYTDVVRGGKGAVDDFTLEGMSRQVLEQRPIHRNGKVQEAAQYSWADQEAYEEILQDIYQGTIKKKKKKKKFNKTTGKWEWVEVDDVNIRSSTKERYRRPLKKGGIGQPKPKLIPVSYIQKKVLPQPILLKKGKALKLFKQRHPKRASQLFKTKPDYATLYQKTLQETKYTKQLSMELPKPILLYLPKAKTVAKYRHVPGWRRAAQKQQRKYKSILYDTFEEYSPRLELGHIANLRRQTLYPSLDLQMLSIADTSLLGKQAQLLKMESGLMYKTKMDSLLKQETQLKQKQESKSKQELKRKLREMQLARSRFDFKLKDMGMLKQEQEIKKKDEVEKKIKEVPDLVPKIDIPTKPDPDTFPDFPGSPGRGRDIDIERRTRNGDYTRIKKNGGRLYPPFPPIPRKRTKKVKVKETQPKFGVEKGIIYRPIGNIEITKGLDKVMNPMTNVKVNMSSLNLKKSLATTVKVNMSSANLKKSLATTSKVGVNMKNMKKPKFNLDYLTKGSKSFKKKGKRGSK
jgi:hypothetical protein